MAATVPRFGNEPDHAAFGTFYVTGRKMASLELTER